MSFLDWLLNPSGLTPHGFCLSWAPGLVAMHAGSDAVIGLAYFSIPLAIAAFVKRRPDIKYGWVAYLFVAFILACGTTHLMAILTLWAPAYGVEALIKVATAILSIATAGILWTLIPKLLALPSAAELERRVDERTAQLRAAKEELEVVVAERTATLAQRDLLLREVYHRVKNNLQMVDGLLIMQTRQLTDPAARQAMQGLRDRIYALGLVHHQLMGSEDLKTFDIAPFLQDLSTNLVHGGPGQEIALSVEAIPLDVGLDFAIPLGLLVTELVTNSLKHAFPDGRGDIDVSLSRAGDGALALVVADNGRGYDGAGSASQNPKAALGVSIIEGLVAQLKGTILVKSRPGATRSEIRLAAPVTP
ncbi:signal transduction histidine kinase [Caulobacter sp. AP07]|uniref:sensor histidine kinase n=1 Tax=Caulobacter sp. AP07 TaxID=1144304 RepID=UPI00027206F5|nr:sensor histidine kinase [Caulobacter sp. AP07]EJL32062.1 signal transduction histidine kinase [Caulobacter sp. AP07]